MSEDSRRAERGPIGATGPILTIIMVLSVILNALSAQADWPQLMHDAQHPGYTPEVISAPRGFIVGWRTDFFEEFGQRIHRLVQVTAYDGKLFVPTEEGSLFALDPGTGRI